MECVARGDGGFRYNGYVLVALRHDIEGYGPKAE